MTLRARSPRPAILGIGTAAYLPNYGLGPAAAPEDALLGAALAGGVRYIDTAADYGDSELAVGRVRTGGVRVCTKVSANGSLENLRASAGRLNGAPDTILMHSAGRQQILGAPVIAALREARETGLTARTGASTYGIEDAALALAQPWVDVVQVEYSILNQSVVEQAPKTRDVQEVVVRSVLCKGLLTSRRSTAPHLVAQVADALAGLDRCAAEWNRSVEELAIRFALDSPGIDVVLVGVSDQQELRTALDAAASPRLTPEQWTQLASFDRRDADAAHPERWGRLS